MKRFFFGLLICLALLGARGYGQALLRNGDVFEVRLSGMPLEYAQEFALQYTISDDGSVDLPYIGAMKATGSSTTQFARAIEKKLVSDKIFTNPTAVINLQPSSRFVTVGGGVRAPQAVGWTADLSLSSAITRAGGKSDFGNLKKVKVTRDGKAQIYNLNNANKDPNQNPKLMPGDEIEVPE